MEKNLVCLIDTKPRIKINNHEDNCKICDKTFLLLSYKHVVYAK